MAVLQFTFSYTLFPWKFSVVIVSRPTRKFNTYSRWRTWCGPQWRLTVSRWMLPNTLHSFSLRTRHFASCWAQVVTRWHHLSAVKVHRLTAHWQTVTMLTLVYHRVAKQIEETWSIQLSSKLLHNMNRIAMCHRLSRVMQVTCHLQQHLLPVIMWSLMSQNQKYCWTHSEPYTWRRCVSAVRHVITFRDVFCDIFFQKLHNYSVAWQNTLWVNKNFWS